MDCRVGVFRRVARERTIAISGLFRAQRIRDYGKQIALIGTRECEAPAEPNAANRKRSRATSQQRRSTDCYLCPVVNSKASFLI